MSASAGSTARYQKLIALAANYILKRDALIVMSGAGMSVDSGVPDFRGDQGLYKQLGEIEKKMSYQEILNPLYFEQHPKKFWYIYGDRYNLIKPVNPHQGYSCLLQIFRNYKMKDGKKEYFSFTSNVDGQWLKAGLEEERLVEFYGNLFNFQCFQCQTITYDASRTFELDREKKECADLPKCSQCQDLLRPNVLLWNDLDFIKDKVKEQKSRFDEFVWQLKLDQKTVTILEIGAGSTYPAIRLIGERLMDSFEQGKAKMVRINPKDEGNSIFGDRYVDIIRDSNIERVEEIWKSPKEMEIVFIQNTAEKTLEDLQQYLKNIS